MKILLAVVIILLVIVAVYLLGPRPAAPLLDTTLPEIPADISALAEGIADAEAAVPNIKPDNEARIVWYDSIPTKTDYSIVYLPGFTATYAEGEPIHREVARRYGCNLYLPRLDGHGLTDPEAFQTLTADRMIASAAQALAVGKQLGEQVIIMSMSTGSTLALVLAADHPELAGVITFSPNIRIKDPAARFLNNPWGLQIARLITGSNYRTYEESEEYKKYWYTHYRLEGVVALQSLLEHSMTPATFARVKQPFFMGYYFKNETEQDEVVSVAAMLDMFEQLGTPPEQKRRVAFPNVEKHAMISYLTSKDLDSVRKETFRFIEEVLGLEAK